MKINKKMFSLFVAIMAVLSFSALGTDNEPLRYSLQVIEGICGQNVNFTGTLKINGVTSQAFSSADRMALDDAALSRHDHANKALLDTYNQTNTDIEDSVFKKHAHANKTLLDAYAQTESDLADAVSKKHDHSNKTLLDAYAQTESDLADAVSKKHAHANSAVLAKFSEAAGKPQYDGQPIGGSGGESIGTVVTLTTSQTWTVPVGVTVLKDVFIIGGGGGGGGGVRRDGGGGGAGGIKHLQNVYVTPGHILTGVIGAGGAGGVNSDSGLHGGNSTLTVDSVVYTATGGGAGQGMYTTNGWDKDGGCGGGRADDQGIAGIGIPATLGKIGIIEGQGCNGYGGDNSAGGGGGYSADGESGSAPVGGGIGGEGLDLRWVVGTSIGDNGWFAGGGAGGSHTTGKRVASGGKGGGGAAGITTGGAGVDGMTNTGGGGGGATNYIGNGGAGGSGIIIIRY